MFQNHNILMSYLARPKMN